MSVLQMIKCYSFLKSHKELNRNTTPILSATERLNAPRFPDSARLPATTATTTYGNFVKKASVESVVDRYFESIRLFTTIDIHGVVKFPAIEIAVKTKNPVIIDT